mmetsp:Transcript_69903/g.216122  ORF Transcript_69903/g.216122 Transcript_69903/m.216122 type:complete len:250 (+) Transcript_69903:919-1668(+)
MHVGPIHVGLRLPVRGHGRADLPRVVHHDVLPGHEALLQRPHEAGVRELAVLVCQEAAPLLLLPRVAVRIDDPSPVALPHAIASDGHYPHVRRPYWSQGHCQDEVAEMVDGHDAVPTVGADEGAVRERQHPLLEDGPKDGRRAVVEGGVQEYQVHLWCQLLDLGDHAPHSREVVEARGDGRGLAHKACKLMCVLRSLARALLIRPVDDDVSSHLQEMDRGGKADARGRAGEDHGLAEERWWNLHVPADP